jgi:hypothetical protein
MPSIPGWFTKITALRLGATGPTPITAHPGGGQANAVPLVKGINQIGTVATIGDSVQLPVAATGAIIVVINSGALAAAVFPSGTDTVNGQAAPLSAPQAAGTIGIYVCPQAGKWYVNVAAETAPSDPEVQSEVESEEPVSSGAKSRPAAHAKPDHAHDRPDPAARKAPSRTSR